MRPIFAYSILAATLLAGACKRSEQDKAEAKFEKAQEHVDDESREMREAQKNLPEGPESTIDKAGRVTRAEEELAAARADYKAEMTRQLVRIDERIRELDAKSDEKSRDTAERLRKHREEFAAKLQRLDSEPPATWEHLKGETDEQLQQMRKESGEAL